MEVQFVLNKDEKGVVREGAVEFPYLKMLIKLWLGDWKTQLKIMNLKVDEENGNEMGIGNGQNQKVRLFPSNEFWKNIGCLAPAPTFGLGVSSIW